jgi:hypothetical protein
MVPVPHLLPEMRISPRPPSSPLPPALSPHRRPPPPSRSAAAASATTLPSRWPRWWIGVKFLVLPSVGVQEPIGSAARELHRTPEGGIAHGQSDPLLPATATLPAALVVQHEQQIHPVANGEQLTGCQDGYGIGGGGESCWAHARSAPGKCMCVPPKLLVKLFDFFCRQSNY